MEISFILSKDELLTLILINDDITEAGQCFVDTALEGAEICDLLSLIDKNFAKNVNDELEVEPVLRMIADAIAHAVSSEHKDDTWKIGSKLIALECQKYPFHEGYLKITPVEEKKDENTN